MEIVPIFSQATDDPAALVRAVVALCCLSLSVHAVQCPRLLRKLVSVRVPTLLSAGALPLFLSSAMAAGGPHSHGGTLIQEIETSPALDERVPPPRSLVRAGDIPSTVHPAIHPWRSTKRTERLFPRATSVEELAPWERGAIDLRRTSKRNNYPKDPLVDQSSERLSTGSHYIVTTGDTLWDIAAKVLGTDDQRAIARYWPRLHKENLDEVGRNPDLIYPGMVLSLPSKEEA